MTDVAMARGHPHRCRQRQQTPGRPRRVLPTHQLPSFSLRVPWCPRQSHLTRLGSGYDYPCVSSPRGLMEEERLSIYMFWSGGGRQVRLLLMKKRDNDASCVNFLNCHDTTHHINPCSNVCHDNNVTVRPSSSYLQVRMAILKLAARRQPHTLYMLHQLKLHIHVP
jgi:hypothetical protein